MPRRDLLKYYYYRCDIEFAFKLDCERFLLEFEKRKTFSFEAFSSIWREKVFSLVFAKQDTLIETHDFTHDCFRTIKKLLFSPINIYTQVGALYLLYGIYYKQPYESLVKIRLVDEEYKQLVKLMEKMEFHQQKEPLYVFTKLKLENAFECVATQRPMIMELSWINIIDKYKGESFGPSRSMQHKLDCLFKEGDALKELAEVDREYKSAMNKYREKNGATSVPRFEEGDIVDSLTNIYERLGKKPDDFEEITHDIFMSKHLLRKKAFTHKPTLPKHYEQSAPSTSQQSSSS